MQASTLWNEWRISGKNVDRDTDCAPIVIDDPYAAVNISIILKNSGRFLECENFNIRIIDLFPRFAPAFHELALVLRYQDRHRSALRFAWKAFELEHDYKYTLVLQLCACGMTDEARAIITNSDWTTLASNNEDKIHSEFARFVTKYSQAAAEAAIQRAADAGNYLNADAVENQILAAIDAKRPFALTRLGDGEGLGRSYPERTSVATAPYTE